MSWNIVDHIIQKLSLKGQDDMAVLVNRSQAAISLAKRRNSLPYDTMMDLLEAGEVNGQHLIPDDFFPPELRGEVERTV